MRKERWRNKALWDGRRRTGVLWAFVVFGARALVKC